MDDYGSQHPQREPMPVDDAGIMSYGDWIKTLLILLIPCVGIVFHFIWAFSPGNVNRRNYCRASLIVSAIFIVLTIALYAFSGMLFVWEDLARELQQY
ncbi:MAG: hypothetical protein LBU32_03265 [Clostridiales bacterium]|nr:hypothetical protein [Clostridiales bacterium]